VENTVWYLRHNRLFDGAEVDVVRECMHLFVQRTYASKSILFQQGDPGRVVYLVKRGKVRISRVALDGKQLTIAILGPGDIFGEEVVFTKDVVRTTQATVIEEAYLCLSRMQDLFALLSRHPLLAINIARYLGERRDDAIETAEGLASLAVPDRIVRLFERLASEHGVPDARGTRIALRLTHADIASLVGSTRETVSVTVGNLTKTGRLIVSHGTYVVPTALAVHS
jgi:CRP/FNR family transcriptional regulator